MLIAVASNDGKEINEHFGMAQRFLIYEVSGDDVVLRGEKAVERYCSDDPDHAMRKPVIEAIAAALKDCRAILCAQIGPAPQMELERLGIDVFSVTGPLPRTLVEMAKVL